ncbi:GMC family oxidoreductase [Hoeflea poritis]|uniref:GMC family oxidoreductase N-terminal domain-containing protein n=1 Tax=Hoeflea poritis TaxID=2993659 RepID=A0ABT4VV03_9HYPH|nr:GMC family oxidoreductase N-terminal domain-containing protein [Hoeflea poritis]MDA4848533.1 GMC family oxidoreductase N-terminal domain-containing protein [Hoeflea poritis]
MTSSTETFDYVVVGSGSAGGIVASRLSASSKYSVVCLEAGARGSGYIWTKIPATVSFMIDDPRVNWCYKSDASTGPANRALNIPRGKILGGTSAINGMTWVRGQHEDYDHWAQIGNLGWAFQDVLPFFKKIESYPVGDPKLRGHVGPIRVTSGQKITPFYDLFLETARVAGIPGNRDYNGADQEGATIAQAASYKGVRESTANRYLDPATRHNNLEIKKGAEATRLLFEAGRCIGVLYMQGSHERKVLARNEVVVCGGAVNSPKLLEHSGIGDAERLYDLGIDVISHLPGVGENLSDHFTPTMKYQITQSGQSASELMHGWRKYREVLRYVLFRRGFLAQSFGAMRAFFRTREDLTRPDGLMVIAPFMVENFEGGRKISKVPGASFFTHVLRPETRGSIHVTSPDPKQPPAIRERFLETENDKLGAIACFKKVRQLTETNPIASILGAELQPGRQVESDDEILQFILETGQTTYHPVGTCKMGQDRDAVVDERLRVHGVHGLRVADASIMPTITSGNTGLPCMMIGEKCAHMIIEDRERNA